MADELTESASSWLLKTVDELHAAIPQEAWDRVGKDARRRELQSIESALKQLQILTFGNWPNYLDGLWSRRNLDAMVQDVEAAIKSLDAE